MLYEIGRNISSIASFSSLIIITTYMQDRIVSFASSLSIDWHILVGIMGVIKLDIQIVANRFEMRYAVKGTIQIVFPPFV